jgi:thioredoxin 1
MVKALFFTGTRCSACKSMHPVVVRLLKEGFKIEEKDVDENRELAEKYRVTTLPTFVILRDNKEVKRFIGITPIASLRDALKNPDYRIY